ncbi:MAG TPA: hypothetical protein VKJ01_10340, partial [Candidatus Solibacter sp.]|nr:hypothetical protein [Candidatus Solibacter sp.]
MAVTKPQTCGNVSKRSQGIGCGSADSGCRGGGPEARHHQSVHSKPMAPERKNTHRQLSVAITSAMPGGAITEPTAVPALTIPIAVPRCSTGYHSATALVAAGKPPPSPIPSRNRLAASIP